MKKVTFAGFCSCIVPAFVNLKCPPFLYISPSDIFSEYYPMPSDENRHLIVALEENNIKFHLQTPFLSKINRIGLFLISATFFYIAVMCSESINNIIHKVNMDAIKMSSDLREMSYTRCKQSFLTKKMFCSKMGGFQYEHWRKQQK